MMDIKRIGTVRRFCLLALLATGLVSVLTPVSLIAQRENPEFFLWARPESYNRKIKPGQTGTWFLQIQSNRTSTLTGIRLSAVKPEGWEVEFSPATVVSLAAGATDTVIMRLTPPANASKGPHEITIVAETEGARRVVAPVFVDVDTVVTVWLWIGIAVAVAVVAGLVTIFLRMGRD